jgi:hypothetical protein
MGSKILFRPVFNNIVTGWAFLQCSALMRGIHTHENIQNGGRSGGECLFYANWLGTWGEHLDDESWRGSGYVFFG